MFRVYFIRGLEKQLGMTFDNEVMARLYKAQAEIYLKENNYNNISLIIE